MKKIVLYSTTGCPLCERYRTLLDEQGFAYEERNTTENPKYLQELGSQGIYAVPTMMIDSEYVQGFRPNTVVELLGV